MFLAQFICKLSVLSVGKAVEIKSSEGGNISVHVLVVNFLSTVHKVNELGGHKKSFSVQIC